MPPGTQGPRRAAAGKAGAADLPERERVTGDDVSAARRRPAAQGLNVCRAGFAGRGTTCTRSTDPHARARFRPETRVSGRS